jgi:hypothetical protein
VSIRDRFRIYCGWCTHLNFPRSFRELLHSYPFCCCTPFHPISACFFSRTGRSLQYASSGQSRVRRQARHNPWYLWENALHRPDSGHCYFPRGFVFDLKALLFSAWLRIRSQSSVIAVASLDDAVGEPLGRCRPGCVASCMTNVCQPIAREEA